MKEQLQLKNHLKEVRTEANLSQAQLAEMVGVSRNTISSIETGQFNPTAKLALILCIALDKKFEEVIMENIIMLILGVFISVLGIVNIKGNISTIHSYNRRKVKEEDIPKYGKTVGTGTLIIGISLVLGFIVSFWSEIIIDYIILPAVIVGLGFILYGQFKYNKGIF